MPLQEPRAIHRSVSECMQRARRCDCMQQDEIKDVPCPWVSELEREYSIPARSDLPVRSKS